jgi:hypothetical protein
VIHQVGLGRLALKGIVLDQQNRRLQHDLIRNECFSNSDKIT